MNTKRKADPRTVLGIVFIFISFGLAVNKPIPSHVLLIICNLRIYTILGALYRHEERLVGDHVIALPRGLYIVVLNHTAKKIMVW